MQEQAEELLSSFEAPLKEFVRLVKSAKTVMNDRSSALQAVHQVQDGDPFSELLSGMPKDALLMLQDEARLTFMGRFGIDSHDLYMDRHGIFPFRPRL